MSDSDICVYCKSFSSLHVALRNAWNVQLNSIYWKQRFRKIYFHICDLFLKHNIQLACGNCCSEIDWYGPHTNDINDPEHFLNRKVVLPTTWEADIVNVIFQNMCNLLDEIGLVYIICDYVIN